MRKTGKILIESAYAQGKMLDHTGWQGQLPRGITPSDVDMRFSFHHSRRSIEVELKFNCASWDHVSYGQLLAYKDEVEAHAGKKVAIIASHSVPPDRQIDSFRDITAFQVMAWIEGKITYSPIMFGSESFTSFVKWYAELPK